MLFFRRLTALSLSAALLIAQAQGALAAVSIVAPVRTSGQLGSAASVGAVPALGFSRVQSASLGLAPSLTGALPSLGLAPQLQQGQAGLSAEAAVEAFQTFSPALLPSVSGGAAAKTLPAPSVKPVRAAVRGSLTVLEKAVAPARSNAGPSRIRRMALMFDGGTKGSVQDVSAVAGRAAAQRPSGLKAPGSRVSAPKNGILGLQAPAAKKKGLSAWKMLKENRFLIAAVGGAALGLAGINLGTLPLLSLTPGWFFGALPWLAAPFIGLNIFRSFSHYSVIKESRTLLGFLVITMAGLIISAGTTMAMTSLLPVVDPATFAAAEIPGLSTGGFSPMQFMLPIIGAFTLLALIYKRARAVNDGTAGREYKPGLWGTLRRLADKAAGLLINKTTSPYLAKGGELGEKAAAFINKAFPRFIDIVGMPAVATLLSMTMATGGMALLHTFSGYYVTAFAGMGVGMLALLAAYFAFGARFKDFKEILKAALVGFSISSSSATMPTEKEALKKMGVSKKTRNTVVPLGGVFNMFGTSLYMGLTAFYALSMFGAAPTLMQYFNTALAILVIAMGAPGIPASNITLLDPVLRQTGLASEPITKVYTMILPGDRILDMAQTALNVLGDMLPAVEQDRKKLRYNRVKHIKEIRRRRQEKKGGR